MPLYHKSDLPGGGRTAIWHVTEDQSEIESMIREQSPGFSDVPPGTRHRRIREWFATRLLISLCGYEPYLKYDHLGKPSLIDEKAHISISHSGPFVAVAVHPKLKAGIDVELTGERILRVKNKFLGASESDYVKPNLECEMLYVIWGAKECAFKIYGKGNVDFRKNLLVNKFNFAAHGNTNVQLKKPGEEENYSVTWEYFGNLMLVYALSKSPT